MLRSILVCGLFFDSVKRNLRYCSFECEGSRVGVMGLNCLVERNLRNCFSSLKYGLGYGQGTGTGGIYEANLLRNRLASFVG